MSLNIEMSLVDQNH